MDELTAVVTAIDNATSNEFALATVVAVAGSTYRLPGARQVVFTDGSTVGTVSGGCLDSDVRATALEVIDTGASRLTVYDLTVDDDALWGWGLGCSGITTVLFESGASARDLARKLRAARQDGKTIAVLTRLGDAPGARVVIEPTGRTGSLGLSDRGEKEAVRLACEALTDHRSNIYTIEGVDVFVEVVEPAPLLLVCGTGNDAGPMVDLGKRLGFEVIVTDERPGALERDIFAAADRKIVCKPTELNDVLPSDRRLYAVLMSHNFMRDGDTLGALCGSTVEYIGLLGPAERTAQLIGYVVNQGVSVSETDRAKLHGPAGLDVGAEGPEQIAWSILTEILAVRSGRSGGHLRDRETSIHPKHG